MRCYFDARLIIINVHRITYSDPEGVERTWESAERLTRPKGTDIDGVGVAAILQDSTNPDYEPRIVLQKQWRPPVDATVIEIPAGLMDPDESPETCAVRELKEETGYIGEVMKDPSFNVSPVMFNGTYLQRRSHFIKSRMICVEEGMFPVMHVDLSPCSGCDGLPWYPTCDIFSGRDTFNKLSSPCRVLNRQLPHNRDRKLGVELLSPAFKPCCMPQDT